MDTNLGNDHYVKYTYDDMYHVTKIKALSESDLLGKVFIYARKPNYTFAIVTEDDYDNYFLEIVNTWSVKKKKN